MQAPPGGAIFGSAFRRDRRPARERKFLPPWENSILPSAVIDADRMRESEAYRRRKIREDLGYDEPVSAKRCTKCGETKGRDEFPVDRMVSDGLSSWCRACKAEGVRRWKAKRKAMKA